MPQGKDRDSKRDSKTQWFGLFTGKVKKNETATGWQSVPSTRYFVGPLAAGEDDISLRKTQGVKWMYTMMFILTSLSTHLQDVC